MVPMLSTSSLENISVAHNLRQPAVQPPPWGVAGMGRGGEGTQGALHVLGSTVVTDKLYSR